MSDARALTELGKALAEESRSAMCLAMPDGRAAPASSLRAVGERRRLAQARTCYDHLAGRLGVAVTEALVRRKALDGSSGLALPRRGESWFTALDIDLAGLRAGRRPLVRECLDWTERRPHLAGSLGAALCARFVERQWVRRTDRTRRLEVTAPGLRALEELLGITGADVAG